MNEHVARDVTLAETRARSILAPGASSLQTRERRLRGVYWLIGGLATLLVVVVVAVAWWVSGTKRTLHYTTVPATRGAVTRAITATGAVNPELTIIVGSYISGVIQELYCDYNTRVQKGQVCARIDPRTYQSAVDQAQANLAIAKAQLEKDKAALAYARLAFDRAAELLRSNAISKDAFDLAKSGYEQAQAQILFALATIEQREAALKAAQVNLDYTSIVSPVDGTVVSRNVTMGQTVAASFQTPTLFLIATDLTRMQVDTNVSESDIGGIAMGNKATFTVDAYPRRPFQGAVSQVRQSPQTVQNVVTYDVVVSVGNQDLALKPGMTAATRIVIDQRDDVLRVPNAALRYRPGGLVRSNESQQTQVWLVRDGKPVAVAVVPGLDDDSFTEIVSGELRAGDRVITAEQVAADRKTAMPSLKF